MGRRFDTISTVWLIVEEQTTLKMVNDLKGGQNRPQGSNLALKVRLRADDQLPNELVFEYT